MNAAFAGRGLSRPPRSHRGLWCSDNPLRERALPAKGPAWTPSESAVYSRHGSLPHRLPISLGAVGIQGAGFEQGRGVEAGLQR